MASFRGASALDAGANPKSPSSAYPWVVVGLLWLCGFFNYADRQAVYAVFDLIQSEFHLSDEQLGLIGSSFMWVYAAASPFSGFIVDRQPRKRLIVLGLAFWSLICLGTGWAWGFAALLFFRAAEGLGESFYFPASMSLLADYHGPKTRSRAMSLHQTSVYVGTAVGGLLAGYLGQYFDWRAPFFILGGIGVVYSITLIWPLREPPRGQDAIVADQIIEQTPDTLDSPTWFQSVTELLKSPTMVALLLAFAAANFVAAAMLAWLPAYAKRQFGLQLTGAAAVATLFWPPANLVGALIGGRLADWAAARHAGGRARVQALGLLIGAPCVYLAGTANSLATVIPALIGIGLGKGIYDANIFAAAYDVVRPRLRGTAAGLMNTLGWTAGSFAPWLIGRATNTYGLGHAIAATAVLYLIAAALSLLAASLTARSARADQRAKPIVPIEDF